MQHSGWRLLHKALFWLFHPCWIRSFWRGSWVSVGWRSPSLLRSMLQLDSVLVSSWRCRLEGYRACRTTLSLGLLCGRLVGPCRVPVVLCDVFAGATSRKRWSRPLWLLMDTLCRDQSRTLLSWRRSQSDSRRRSLSNRQWGLNSSLTSHVGAQIVWWS